MKRKYNISIGDKFGRLTVLKEIRGSNNRLCYVCKCECGKEKIVDRVNLGKGATQSCGCLQKEKVSEFLTKHNRFEIRNGYAVGFTTNTNKEFLIDIEDLERVSAISWYEGKNGYVMHKDTGHSFDYLHRYIMNPLDGLVVDHINHNKMDNRKANLRNCSYSDNGLNREIKPRGIVEVKRGNRRYYSVQLRGRYRGLFKDLKSAEEKRNQILKEEYFDGKFYE